MFYRIFARLLPLLWHPSYIDLDSDYLVTTVRYHMIHASAYLCHMEPPHRSNLPKKLRLLIFTLPICQELAPDLASPTLSLERPTATSVYISSGGAVSAHRPSRFEAILSLASLCCLTAIVVSLSVRLRRRCWRVGVGHNADNGAWVIHRLSLINLHICTISAPLGDTLATTVQYCTTTCWVVLLPSSAAALTTCVLRGVMSCSSRQCSV